MNTMEEKKNAETNEMTELEATELEMTGLETTESATAGNETAGLETTESVTAGNETAGFEATEPETTGNEMSRNKTAESEVSEIDAKISELMERDAKGNGKGKKRKKWPKKKKRIVLIGVAIVLLLFILSKVFGKENALIEVETAALDKGSIQESISITGPIEGTDSVDVTSNLHAKILSLNVKEGDRVEAGVTVLAQIDTTDLEKEREIAKGNYDLAVVTKDETVKETQRAYEKAMQDRRAAEADYSRKAQLAASGDIPQVELQAAQNTLNDAKRAVEAYKVKNGKVVPNQSLDIQINNARLALEKIEEQIQNATIIAPISGTVTRVNTKVGQFADDVEEKRPLLTIENLDELQMEIKISEYSIGKVKPGQAVRITADILGEGAFVNGEVISISPTGEEKGGGSTERVIPTKIAITDRNTALIAGITAKAEIILNEAEDTYVVPISAVGRDAEGNSVMQFVEEDSNRQGVGNIRIMPVKTGLESDINVEILEDPMNPDALSRVVPSNYLVTYRADLFEGMQVQLASKTDMNAAMAEETEAAVETDAEAMETAAETDTEETEAAETEITETEVSETEAAGTGISETEAAEIHKDSADNGEAAEAETAAAAD